MSENDEEQQFIEDLFARGQVIWEENYNPEEGLPSGVTHVAKKDDNGQVSVRRIRFSAF